MEITIDIDAPVPLFTQLIEQIKKAVQEDELGPGDPLPSIRQLANDLDINAKTVAKAYRRLERDSVIRTQGYRGTYVHPDAKVNCTIDLKALAVARLTETVRALRAVGVTDSEIRNAFGEAIRPDGSR